MTENKEVMSRNIKFYMDKIGVNATEVCNALGFKQNTFSDWINGKTYPRIDAIEKMANYFKISKAFLVEDFRHIEFFTPEEQQLILEFRKSDHITQETIRRLLAYKEKLGELK